MSELSTLQKLRDCPAFAGLSSQGMAALDSGSRLLSFEIGDVLCHGQQISSDILWLVDGQARLLSRERGRLFTVEKLGPGSFV